MRDFSKYAFHWDLGGNDQSGGLEQNEQELSMLTDFIKKKKINSFLEIGLAKGDLQRYMMDLGLQCFGVTPDKKDSHEGLYVAYGLSQSSEVIGSVEQFMSRVTPTEDNPEPIFDLIFVDGDHSYEAVKADYKNYKGLCRYMAFHDCLGLRNCEGVAKFWSELKSKYQFIEFIADDKKYASGIGIVLEKKRKWNPDGGNLKYVL